MDPQFERDAKRAIRWGPCIVIGVLLLIITFFGILIVLQGE